VKFVILTAAGEILQKWSIATDIQNDGKKIVPNIIDSINGIKCVSLIFK
jgi:glucokinase